MKKFFASMLAIFFPAVLSANVEQADPARFAELIASEDTLLIDVRTPGEVDEAKIPDALEIDFYSDDFAEKIAKLPKDKTLLLYCRSGNRSGQTAKRLEDQGYTKLVNLAGGINAWKAANLPLKK